MPDTKTDNGHLKHKLELRRYFLRKYHGDKPPHVFDCCQGSKVIWTQLQSEFATASYWGVDVKPKPGRLKIDSTRVLSQPGWNFDVIDCDTYGSPWKHYVEMCRNATKPVTVFLTIGKPILAAGGRSISKQELQAIGIDFDIPPGFGVSLCNHATECLLQTGCSNDTISIIEAVEAVADGNARYIGIRIEPMKKDAKRANASRPTTSVIGN